MLLVGIIAYCIHRNRRRCRLRKQIQSVKPDPKTVAPPTPTSKPISLTSLPPQPETLPIEVQPGASTLMAAPSTQPSTSASKPEPSLPLEKTQTLSSPTNSMSITRKAAKHAPRDPRFPHLIPGTIEFMVAECGTPKTEEIGGHSGTRDDSKAAEFVNPP